jgi:hypothetical protein
VGFTGCYDKKGIPISMKNSDYIRDGMAIIVKNRIRKKLRLKQKKLEILIKNHTLQSVETNKTYVQTHGFIINT